MNLDSPLRRMVYASMFGALTAIGSFIALPIQPVPITLQTLFTGLAALLLGGTAGALSQIIYVLLGILGLPVFAGGKAGLGVLLGPTGGYLIGFIAAAYFTGKIAEQGRQAGLIWKVTALTIGYFTIYLLGTLWLSFSAHLGFAEAFLIGVVPFLPGDLAKLLAAAILAEKLVTYFSKEGDWHD